MRRTIIGLTGAIALGIGAFAIADQPADQQPTNQQPTKGQPSTDEPANKPAHQPGMDQPSMKQTRDPDRDVIDQKIATWPARSRALAYLMMHKYGMPAEASSNKLVWNNNGPFKRTVVMREGAQHDFPRPHTDVLEQTVEFRVPADRFDELAMFDGSVNADRTKGELKARCDSEEANLLALNLAAEIASGKRTPDQARQELARSLIAFMTTTRTPDLMTGLKFGRQERTADADRATLEGAPRKAEGKEVNDGSILGLLHEANLAEVRLSGFVAQHATNADVKGFARMMREEHGAALGRIMKLGPQIKVQPVHNGLVMDHQNKSDEGLARVAREKGAAFDRAFIDFAVQEHQELLDAIDRQLSPGAEKAEVKRELSTTRQMISKHLAQARKLQNKYKTAAR